MCGVNTFKNCWQTGTRRAPRAIPMTWKDPSDPPAPNHRATSREGHWVGQSGQRNGQVDVSCKSLFSFMRSGWSGWSGAFSLFFFMLLFTSILRWMLSRKGFPRRFVFFPRSP